MRLQSNACLIFKLFDNEMNFLFVWEIGSESVGLFDRPGSMPWRMADREYPSPHHRVTVVSPHLVRLIGVKNTVM